MNKIPLIITLIFFISLVFCNEKYTFLPRDYVTNKMNIGKITKTRVVEESYFDLPGVGSIHRMNKFISVEEYLGEKDGFLVVKVTRTDMETKNRVGPIEEIPYDYLAMEDIPCLVYIGSNGWDDHVEPVNPDHDWLQEVFEAAYIHNTNFTNTIYPFGEEAVNVSVGDKWYDTADSIKRFLNSESPESMTSIESTYELKKVRSKRGRNIATVDIQSNMKMKLNYILHCSVCEEHIFLSGDASGSFDTKVNFDIETFEIVSHKDFGNLWGDFEMDGDNFRTKITLKSFSNIVK